MSKSIEAQLLADIQANVTTLATLVEIRRQDRRPIRMTNHDVSIDFAGDTYDHTIPFVLSSINKGSQFEVDNCTLTLMPDESIITRVDFEYGVYQFAEVIVSMVDFTSPDDGRMIIHKGTFGEFKVNELGAIDVTLVGLLKILDFQVGRIYQPTCDADLGDKRCKLAIKESQAYSHLNIYNAGDWVYRYNPAGMDAFTLTNPSFNADGDVANGAAITGWTQSPNSGWIVDNARFTLSPYEGTHALWGDVDDPASADGSGAEIYLYQDIDLTAELTTGAIDSGHYSFAAVAAVIQTVYTLDPLRLYAEQLDGDGEVIRGDDTKWVYFDTGYFGEWQERTLAFPLLEGARTVRFYLYGKKEHQDIIDIGFDDVRAYYWDHTLGTPYDDVIHKAVRVVNYSDNFVFYPTNASFEKALVANTSTAGAINGWTITGGDFWQVVASFSPLSAQDGSRFVVGGDDGGSSQQTYHIKSEFNLSSVAKINDDRKDLGYYVGRLSLDVGWADTASAASVTLALYNGGSLLSTITALAFTTQASPGWGTVTQTFSIPANCTKIVTNLYARSPSGDGAANVAFDGIEYHFYDAEQPTKSDPTNGYGSEDTIWDTTIGSYTFDGNLIWKAVGMFRQYSEVDAVLDDRKEFTCTNTFTASTGAFETGLIEWTTGANRGRRSVIRNYTPKVITPSTIGPKFKLYFPTPYPIEEGDSFFFIRPCAKRFTQDCIAVFNNAVNFRGFPHLPGKTK